MKLPGSPRTLPGRSQEAQETPGRLPGIQEAPGRTTQGGSRPWAGFSILGSRFSLDEARFHSWKQVLI